jgi:hypothetical protein
MFASELARLSLVTGIKELTHPSKQMEHTLLMLIEK